MRHYKSRRGIAVHEAGHAVACLALDICFSEVAIFTSPKMSGRGVMCYGAVIVEKGSIYPAIHLAMSSLAGPIAEAKYKKKSLVSVALSGGLEDFKDAEESLAVSQYNYELIEQETKKLVALYWHEIVSVADALMLHGTLGRGAVAMLAPLACDCKETEEYNHISRIIPYRAKQRWENALTKSAR